MVPRLRRVFFFFFFSGLERYRVKETNVLPLLLSQGHPQTTLLISTLSLETTRGPGVVYEVFIVDNHKTTQIRKTTNKVELNDRTLTVETFHSFGEK